MAKLLVVPFLVLVTVLALPHPSSAIVGGEDADIKDYPYTLSVMWYDYHFCGAVLVAPKWALTSARCVEITYDDLQIRAGSTTHSGGQVVNVTGVYQCPRYNSRDIDYDITILELDEEINHPNARVIELVESGYISEEGAIATTTGWGDLKEGGPPSDVLQKLDVPMIDQDTCDYYYGGLITTSMVCAGYLEEGGRSFCDQDDGGPLVVGDKLVGLVSWSIGCGIPYVPGVYTAIAEPYINSFIKNITGI